MTEYYFIVLDEAPIRSRPKYDLMLGNPETAIGVHRASGRTIKELLAKVPKKERCYRTFLARTDGKTGFKLIKAEE